MRKVTPRSPGREAACTVLHVARAAARRNGTAPAGPRSAPRMRHPLEGLRLRRCTVEVRASWGLTLRLRPPRVGELPRMRSGCYSSVARRPRSCASRHGDGVRVSFENSTVCRALCSDWWCCASLMFCSVSAGPVSWCRVFGSQFLLESLILAQDERWRRA